MARPMSHCIVLLFGVFFFAPNQCAAFAPQQVSSTTRRQLDTTASRALHMAAPPMVGDNADESKMSSQTRRESIKKIFGGVGLAWLSISNPAFAEEEMELKRANNAKAAFDDLRFELNDPSGGVAYLQSKIDKEDFPEVMEFTKGYDLELRKKKIGRAKKQLTDVAFRDTATLTANAITFDLIGINRSSRPGQENKEQANKYLNELRTDLSNMIDLEKTIDYEDINTF